MLELRSVFALAIACIMLPVLSACGGGAASVATSARMPGVTASAPAQSSTATLAIPTKAPSTAAAVPPSATPPSPTVGGTLVIGMSWEPTTLDVHKAADSGMEMVMTQVGATLITRDPTTGKFVPYLAESWKVSEDGLTVDFVLRKGVKFHDGSPLTAADYAWTFNRAIDPETRSVGARQMLSSLASAEALDDSTVRLNQKSPFFPLLYTLSFNSYCSALPKAAVEALGDQFGRQPIGAGPYKFKEWRTGEKIIIERNPDFKWGPAFTKAGPYIQTIEYRIIAEYATVIAGVEAGEIDYYMGVQGKDLQRIKDTGRFQIFESVQAGFNPYLQINVSRAPFDDLKVRKAFTLAVDRQALIKAAVTGDGVEMRGPLSSTIAGYSPEQEKAGYGFDLAQAKALMQEAGYTIGANGMLEKDGQPLKLTLKASPIEARVAVAEILKEQYKSLGVEMEIALVDPVSLFTEVLTGEFEICVFGFTHPESDILFMVFAGEELGGGNVSHVKDSELDKLFSDTHTIMDSQGHQQAVDAVAARLIQRVYMIPLYTPVSYVAMDNRVKGAVYSPVTLELWLNDAYISEESTLLPR